PDPICLAERVPALARAGTSRGTPNALRSAAPSARPLQRVSRQRSGWRSSGLRRRGRKGVDGNLDRPGLRTRGSVTCNKLMETIDRGGGEILLPALWTRQHWDVSHHGDAAGDLLSVGRRFRTDAGAAHGAALQVKHHIAPFLVHGMASSIT